MDNEQSKIVRNTDWINLKANPAWSYCTLATSNPSHISRILLKSRIKGIIPT
jgi:hypothetical protein